MMKTFRLLFLLCFTLSGSLIFHAQDERWATYEDSGKNISFEAPSRVLIHRDKDWIRLNAFSHGAVFSVTTDKVENPQKLVKAYSLNSPKGTTTETITSKDFLIRRWNKPGKDGMQVEIYAASATSWFHFHTFGPPGDPTITRFIGSIRIGGVRLVPDPTASAPTASTPSVAFDRLPTSREVQAALDHDNRMFLKPSRHSVKEALPVDYSELSRNLIILRKPRPGYTDETRQRGWEGVIRANVEFLKTGDIGNIVIDKWAPNDLAQNVAIAIWKIKFIPAEVDGKRVDVTRTLTYSFRMLN